MVARLIAPINGQASSSPTSANIANPVNVDDLLFLIAYQNTAGVASATGLTATYGARQLGASVNRATPLQGAGTGSTGASISVAQTASPTTTYVVGAEFSGVTTTEDVTASYVASSGTGTTLSAGSVTTTGVEVLLLAWLATQTAVGAAATIDNSFQVIPGATAARLSLAYKYVTAAAAYSATWTFASTASAAAGIQAFRVATGIPRGDLAGFIG